MALLENSDTFEAMRRIHEGYSSAGAINPELLAVIVQTSGKGNPEYAMRVACEFKHLAGDDWDILCQIYDTSNQKTDEHLKLCRGMLRVFWKKVFKSPKCGEFLYLAVRYKQSKEAA